MKRIDVTIIIPVYNVEEYLRSCLETVVNQTLKQMEIILVNDGSTDGSLKICQEYVDKYNNIVLINKENGGLSSARNEGMKIAKGDYIAFLDSDDFVDIKMYEKLFKVAHKTQADIVFCLSQNVNEHYHLLPNEECTLGTKLYTKNDIFNQLYFQKEVRFEVWTKLYKRKIIENIKFKEKQVYEDVYFERLAFSKSEKFILLEDKLHYYLVSRKGNTNSSFDRKRLDVFKEFDDWVTMLEQQNYELALNRFRMYCLSFTLNLYVLAKKNQADIETLQEINKYFKKYKKDINYFEIIKTDVKLFIRMTIFKISKTKYYELVTRKSKE